MTGIGRNKKDAPRQNGQRNASPEPTRRHISTRRINSNDRLCKYYSILPYGSEDFPCTDDLAKKFPPPFPPQKGAKQGKKRLFPLRQSKEKSPESIDFPTLSRLFSLVRPKGLEPPTFRTGNRLEECPLSLVALSVSRFSFSCFHQPFHRNHPKGQCWRGACHCPGGYRYWRWSGYRCGPSAP